MNFKRVYTDKLEAGGTVFIDGLEHNISNVSRNTKGYQITTKRGKKSRTRHLPHRAVKPDYKPDVDEDIRKELGLV